MVVCGDLETKRQKWTAEVLWDESVYRGRTSYSDRSIKFPWNHTIGFLIIVSFQFCVPDTICVQSS